MSKKIQCENCGNAEYGEDLYKYNGEIFCRYCIVSRICESTIPCEFYAECNDTTKKIKKCDCKQKDQRIAELQKENEELKQQLVIKPKFEIGNYFYIIRKEKKDIKKGYIRYIWNGRMDGIERFKIQLPDVNNVTRKQNELFATKEQAEEELERLNNGKD
jgi:hypothetical protein